MRLTPEREQEIREKDAGSFHARVAIDDLIAEIDALRVEKNRLRPCRGCPTVECTCFSELEDHLLNKLDDVLKERDRLKIELQASLTITEASIRIKNEIEEAYERIIKLNDELSTDLVNREAVIGHLKDSIAKLKEDMANASSSP